MRQSIRQILLVTILLVVVTGGIAVWVFSAELLRWFINRELAEQGYQITHIDLLAWTGQKVEFANAELVSRDRSVILQAKQGVIEYTWHGLVARRLESVEIDQLSIQIAQNQSESFANNIALVYELLTLDWRQHLPLKRLSIGALELPASEFFASPLAIALEVNASQVSARLSTTDADWLVEQRQRGNWSLKLKDQLQLGVKVDSDKLEATFNLNVVQTGISHLFTLFGDMDSNLEGSLTAKGRVSYRNELFELNGSLVSRELSYQDLSLLRPILKFSAQLHLESQTERELPQLTIHLDADAVQAKLLTLQRPQLELTARLKMDTKTSQPSWLIEQMKLKSLSVQGQSFSLTSSLLEVDKAFTLYRVDNAWKVEGLRGHALANTIQLSLDRAEAQLKQANLEFSLASNVLQGKGQSRLPVTNLPVEFTFSHNWQSSTGKLKLSPLRLTADQLQREIKALVTSWPDDLELATGRIVVTTTLDWDLNNARIKPDVRLSLLSLGGKYGEIFFSGLKSHFEVKITDQELKFISPEVSIKTLDVGMPFTNLHAAAMVGFKTGHEPLITLNSFEGKFVGGIIFAHHIRLDLGRKSNDFNLDFKGVDMAQLAELHKVDGLEVNGRLSGRFPVRLGAVGTQIRAGKASADKPGGSIHYVPEDGGAGLATASPQGQLLVDALSNFNYDSLDIEVDYQPDGMLELRMAFKGHNPGLYGERSIHLNLNLEQNVLSLLESIRRVQGISDEIDQAVRHRYGN